MHLIESICFSLCWLKISVRHSKQHEAPQKSLETGKNELKKHTHKTCSTCLHTLNFLFCGIFWTGLLEITHDEEVGHWRKFGVCSSFFCLYKCVALDYSYPLLISIAIYNIQIIIMHENLSKQCEHQILAVIMIIIMETDPLKNCKIFVKILCVALLIF